MTGNIRNIKARSCHHCYCGKAISITYSECVSVALFMQHATRIRHTVISAARLYDIFPYYLIKRHDLREKFTGHKICVLIFSTTFV